MKSYLLRGAFANQYELQNYEPIAKEFNLTVVTSREPLTPINIPTLKLSSPHDMPEIPFKNAILNRLMTDSHWLVDLESHIEGADLVHAAETYYAYTHQAVEMKKNGLIKALISTCWETIPHNNEGVGSRSSWKSDARRYIDHFVTPTLRAKHALIKEGVEENKISVIKMGVDIERFHPVKVKEKVNRVLFVGRFAQDKGIDRLIEVAKQFPHIHFRFVGSGHIIPYGLNTSVARSPYSKIHIEYKNADILVMPSVSSDTWEEQYGMVLAEAMASGLPIIASSSGSIPEVLDGSAVVTEVGVDSLSYSLSDLINNYDMRIKLSQSARNRAEIHFNRINSASEIRDLYNRIL